MPPLAAPVVLGVSPSATECEMRTIGPSTWASVGAASGLMPALAPQLLVVEGAPIHLLARVQVGDGGSEE